MQSVLDKNVTLFKNYASNSGGVQVNLLKYLQSTKYYERQLEIAALKERQPKEYKDQKAGLICILPSCSDCTERASNATYTHTGLIQVDMDQDDNTHVKDWNELKGNIAQIPQVAYCGLSISSKGLWAIIPIEYSEKHLEHFHYIEKYFADRGYTIDASCKNIQRLRGYAYDPTACYNHKARTLSNYCKPNEGIKRPQSKIIGSTDNHYKVKAAIDQINSRNIDIAPDYDTYLELAFSFATEFGSSGEGYFLDVCSHHQDYDEKKAINKYKNALATNSGRVTIGTFFHLCKTAGISLQPNNNRKNSRKTNFIPFSSLKNNTFENVKSSKKEKVIESSNSKELETREKNVHLQEKKFDKITRDDLNKLKLEVTRTIKDPSYLKWLIKNVDRVIQTGIPRNRYDPEVKELFDSVNYKNILP